MAEVDNTQIIGDFACRITGWDDPTVADTQLHKLNRYDNALGSAKHGALHLRPASFFVIDLYVLTTANANAKPSAKIAAPYPLTIWAADVGCESAAGGTGTIDLQVDAASILDAAEDVKTGAGTCVRVAPEDGSEDVDYGSTIHIIQTAGGGAGDMIGGQAHIYAQRL